MNPPAVSAENVFARAAELPPGTARDELVRAESGGNLELQREVESLLKALDSAGDFLSERVLPANIMATSSAGSGLRPAANDAAFQAGTFLGRSDQGSPALEAFIAALPDGIRRETRERIEAGRRVLQGDARIMLVTGVREDSPPILPGFRLERKLGEGSLGVVYAAHDEKLDRRVAIKILHCANGAGRQREILNEARKAAALNDPAIVTIYSVLDEATPPAIVMELVEGFPLDRFAVELSFEQKARILREVARALAVAHRHGVIHRDLKPDNIFVGPEMRPRILDFGLALSLNDVSRHLRCFEGTPLYASPEQVRGLPLTPASDLFSFGSLMFKVLTGRVPFGGETVEQTLKAIATTTPPFLREVAVGVPEELQAICLACLAWNPEDRPKAEEIAIELGRFLVGEPVRLKPRLYDDLLRRSISEYSNRAETWASQSIISREERDALEVMHRRLLADEDHWIVDARRITPLQTVLSAATWLAVVATVLMVWMLRHDLAPFWRWSLPAFFTAMLLLAGWVARRERDALAAATFLAGATLAVVPCTLSLLAELHLFSVVPPQVKQLFEGVFTNQQIVMAVGTGFFVSAFSLWRLKMTGFAWTTAVLGAGGYIGLLTLFNWLDQKPEIRALWILPLAAVEPVALWLERKGRVRWTLPFHLVSLLAMVIGLDVIAACGPTLQMLGLDGARWTYFDHQRLESFSFVLNGLMFLGLMLLTERAGSLDLRRASKWLEVLALVHILTALFVNALHHRNAGHVRVDVWLYLTAAALFMTMAPFRSRWRMLVGGLAGCGLGCYLLVELGLVERQKFIIGLAFAGLLGALGAFAYARRRERGRSN